MIIYGVWTDDKVATTLPKKRKKHYNIFSSKKPMKALLNFYLASALSVTTVATGACFVWYVQEYGAAYKYHKVAPEVSVTVGAAAVASAAEVCQSRGIRLIRRVVVKVCCCLTF